MRRKLTQHERLSAEAFERDMAAAPEATMQRRDFLRRSAYAAGAAGAAASLPLNLLLGEAASRAATATPLPSAANMPIDHFVVLMMENRSFDHYFGWLPNADGVQQRTYTDPDNGNASVATRHASTLGDAQWQGCGHPDPDHSWGGGRAQLGSSRTDPRREPDGFLAGANDEFALCYYDEGDLGFIHAAGREFTVYDRFHCSLMGPTWPNRYYNWSAQSGGRRTTRLRRTRSAISGRRSSTARSDNRAASTARYYNSDLPFSAVWGPRGATWTRPVADYYADCAAGTLPNITFVDPPFRDGGGGDGVSADEHPLGDVRLGQAFMSDVVHAFIESPNWERGALFIVYDEWGGFFDHVRPPSVPDARRSTNMDNDFGLMGFRIPAVVGLALREARLGQPPAVRVRVDHQAHQLSLRARHLTTRDARAQNIGAAWPGRRRTSSGPTCPTPTTSSRPRARSAEATCRRPADARERPGRAGGPRRALRHPDGERRAPIRSSANPTPYRKR